MSRSIKVAISAYDGCEGGGGREWDLTYVSGALIKKKTKFSPSMREFRWDRLQSHILEGPPSI
jgi:hypothetical protein